MANHPSAEKRNRQRIRRTIRNKAIKSSVRALVKYARAAFSSENKEQIQTALKIVVEALDKAATKGVYHRKTSSRIISRLSAQAMGRRGLPPARKKLGTRKSEGEGVPPLPPPTQDATS